MTTPNFVTIGQAPRIARVEAIAFHDGAGRIRHIHHWIVFEGATRRPYEEVLKEARTEAHNLGTDVSRLRELRITKPFNPAAQHKVDVKRGVLVEVKVTARPAARRTTRGTRPRQR
jgi:hypothetical protein